MVARNPSPPEFRILLDQGFPKPTGFAIGALDQSVVVTHLSDFAPILAANSTPDWYIYCAAAEGGFNALVVRDRSQLDQLAEMYVLSRLSALSIVTWRKGIDDPVREWGQLLAYLPDVKKRCLEGGGRAILLPAPSLSKESFFDPANTVGLEAKNRQVSTSEVQRAARAEIEDWLAMSGEPNDRFDTLLKSRKRPKKA
jgi:hypothetical protein